MDNMDTIDSRIRSAEEALNSYPKWVRDNNYFQGGERVREESPVTRKPGSNRTKQAKHVTK